MNNIRCDVFEHPPKEVWGSRGLYAGDYIFQTPQFHEIFGRSHNAKSFGFLLTNEKDNIGYFNACLMKAVRWMPSVMQSRFTIFSSPVLGDDVNKAEFYDAVLPLVEARIKGNCLFAEWRNSEDPSSYRGIFEKHGWVYIPYQNFLLDLDRSADVLWKSINKNARNNIHKARSKGVSVRCVAPSEASVAYKMIRELYERKNMPLFDESVFTDAFRILHPLGMLRGVFAMLDERIIATRLVLLHNRIMFDWYAASDRKYSCYYPNEVLAWDMMEYGAAHDFKVFDFGGAGVKGQYYGPARFKQKFNGKLVEYGRFVKPLHPWLYSIVHSLYEKRKRAGGAYGVATKVEAREAVASSPNPGTNDCHQSRYSNNRGDIL